MGVCVMLLLQLVSFNYIRKKVKLCIVILLTYVCFERQLIQSVKNVAKTSQVQTHQTLLEMISQFSHKWYIPSPFFAKSF